MREALFSNDMANLVNAIIDKEHELLRMGIPEEEAHRVVVEEFSNPLVIANGWYWSPTGDPPGDGEVPMLTNKVPDTGYPPIPPLPVFADTQVFGNDGIDHKNPDPPGYAGGRDVNNLTAYKTNVATNKVIKSAPYPWEDQHKINSSAIANDPESQPSMHGEESWVGSRDIPEWRYDIEDDHLSELEVTRDKRTNKFVSPQSKGELITDKSLPQALDKQRGEYLQKQADGEVEMPHMVVDGPEVPDEPHMTVEQETEPDLWEYVYQGHDEDDICSGFNGKVFDLASRAGRPVPPSEGLGYTNTHPNCHCYWKPATGDFEEAKLRKNQKQHIEHIHRHIGQKARHGNLHKVHRSGKLYKTTTDKNPLRETLAEIRQEFEWLTDDYLDKVKQIKLPGRRFLIRASNEAITDHRSEGEPYRRLLSGDELHAMARTATGKNMDINHRPELKTKSDVIDSEYDRDRKEIQMIVNEADPEVLQAIDNGQITAVSINGGAPRHESIECPSCSSPGNCECFIVPKGVILGELDGIALTWVVTDPNGMFYRGQKIPPATPGVKTTAIQPL
jgi:hypothetical protein